MPADQPPVLQPELIGKLIQNQAKDLELKARELELQAQQDKHSYEFAKAALSVKSAGQAQKHGHEQRVLIIKAVALVAAMLIIAGLIGFSLHGGHESVAMEIVKALVYLSSGAVGGYGLGRWQGKPKDPPTE